MLKIKKMGKCLLMPASQYIDMFDGCRFYLIKDPLNFIGLLDNDDSLAIEDIRCSSERNLMEMLASVNDLVTFWGMKRSYYAWDFDERYRDAFEGSGYSVTENCLSQNRCWYQKEVHS